jgi:hypothetical protein
MKIDLKFQNKQIFFLKWKISYYFAFTNVGTGGFVFSKWETNTSKQKAQWSLFAMIERKEEKQKKESNYEKAK